MKARVHLEGKEIEATFSEGVIFSSGEFCCNLDFTVLFSQTVKVEDILKNIRIQIPGKPGMKSVLAYETVQNGMAITVDADLCPTFEDLPLGDQTMNVVWSISPRDIPDAVDVFWMETSTQSPIGKLRIQVRADEESPQESPEIAYSVRNLSPKPIRPGMGCGGSLLVIGVASLLLWMFSQHIEWPL